jgi:dTDP-glucose 4,6-dehydratase
MKILVAGGAGFVGSHYVRTLLSGGYPGFGHARVTVLDKLTRTGNLANLEPVSSSRRFSFVLGDIRDAALVRSLVSGHDAVINFAAYTDADRPVNDTAELISTNVAGVQVLLQACLEAGVGRVVQVSTADVYGSIDTGSSPVGTPLEPDSPFAASKAGGDLIAQSYAKTYGLNVSITRCCGNYGPYQSPDRVIPLLVTNLLDRRQIPFYGDGGDVRRWIHVDDHCRGIQLVLERGTAGQVYHINGDAELSSRKLTDLLLDMCGADWNMVSPVAERGAYDRRCSLDDSEVRAMGYAPRIRFNDGLKSTVRWYQDNRAWWEPVKQAAAPTPAPVHRRRPRLIMGAS